MPDYLIMTAAQAPPLPACCRCGRPGEVPVRPHGIALCGSCYLGELAVSVDTSGPVPA